MEYSSFSKEKANPFKKKIIPWHVQKRYMESLSQLSLNQTIAKAFYKKEIKSLKLNNKHLALALQRSRYLATEKENLLIDNGKILDIVNFSRLKLTNMATNMKQATACLDETLLLLNSAIRNNSSKCSPNNLNCRIDFKNKLQELNIEGIKEVIESSPENTKNVYVHKGKIARVDDCISSSNKKCKLGKKEENIKRNSKDSLKYAEKSTSALSNPTSKNSSIKDLKKCGSALNIKSQRKKSLPKSSSIETTSSFKSPTSSSNLSLRAKHKRKYQDKKCKPVKVMLTDIAANYSPETNKPISSTSSTNLQCSIEQSAEDNILIKKYISSQIMSKQKISTPNSYSSPFESSINDVEIPNTSQNASNFSHRNVSSGEVPLVKEDLRGLSLKEKEDFLFDQPIAVVKKHQNKEVENSDKQNRRCSKNTDSEKDYKSHNSIVARRTQFYFDEDSIENVDEETTSSNNRIRKCINKCKARKTVSNVKRNSSSKSTVLQSNCILPDNVSKLGKNSFLVTAEVHSPPNGFYAQEMENKIYATEKGEPCVVLTDVFKSNQGLLSEMVGNCLQKKGCLQKTTNSAEAPFATVNDMNAVYMDFENNAENRCLPEAREIIGEKVQRRRSKIVSYKEPSLHVKMRRLF